MSHLSYQRLTRLEAIPAPRLMCALILEKEVNQSTYERIRCKLGAQTTSKPSDRSTFKTDSTHAGGDPNDHVTQNTSGATIPVTKNVTF